MACVQVSIGLESITLFVFAVIIGFSWLLLQFLNVEKQIESVAELENKDLEITFKPASVSLNDYAS